MKRHGGYTGIGNWLWFPCRQWLGPIRTMAIAILLLVLPINASTGNAAACACRKSNADILVVQPAENWAANNLPGSFDGTRERRILPQGEMCPGAIVICYV
jgi:hypothetical protein